MNISRGAEREIADKRDEDGKNIAPRYTRRKLIKFNVNLLRSYSPELFIAFARTKWLRNAMISQKQTSQTRK
jgi:hypothetical protein